ncbi:MAG: hypothetical protein JNL82_29830 [Myxococcales bacterium]|nr:hypothetical protein [Myxococcales bacterium]
MSESATEPSNAQPTTPARDGQVQAQREPQAAAPKPPGSDPMMAKMLGYERKIAELEKGLDTERARVKQFERDKRKAAIFDAVAAEFPGLSRQDIRGAALVAAEDGHIDLFAEDQAAAIAHLKEALLPKSKASPGPLKPATPPASLGGTAGTAGKPPSQTSKFLI